MSQFPQNTGLHRTYVSNCSYYYSNEIYKNKVRNRLCRAKHRPLTQVKFFNIRYECNDARDDFNSQRQQGKFSKVPNEHSFVPYMFEGDQQNDHDRVIDEWDIEGLVGK